MWAIDYYLWAAHRLRTCEYHAVHACHACKSEAFTVVRQPHKETLTDTETNKDSDLYGETPWRNDGHCHHSQSSRFFFVAV